MVKQMVFPSPKRGKRRMALKQAAAIKTKQWEKTPYVRHGILTMKSRPERSKWRRTLKDFIGQSEEVVTRILIKDDMLYDWNGKLCPFCAIGALGKLKKVKGRGLRHRCSHRGCQKFVTPHHHHPIFSEGAGSGATSLVDQAAVLFCHVAGIGAAKIHVLCGNNHKMIDDFGHRLDQARKTYVQKEGKTI